MSVASGGFFQPVIYLYWAFVFFIAAFFTYGITLLLTIGFVVWYHLDKSLLVQVVSSSSWDATICFKRSVIEGVDVDYDNAIQVVDILNKLVMRQTAKQ